MATECLSEYLERDITEDTLSNMKIMVQDKTKLVCVMYLHVWLYSIYRYCELRSKVVLEYVYEGYDNDFWEFIE